MTPKERLIREAILKRVDAIDIAIITSNADDTQLCYLEGKRDGLMQAYSLIGSSLDSIKAEL